VCNSLPTSDNLHLDAVPQRVCSFGALAGLLCDHGGCFEWAAPAASCSQGGTGAHATDLAFWTTHGEGNELGSDRGAEHGQFILELVLNAPLSY
jgi:hypothetical protein